MASRAAKTCRIDLRTTHKQKSFIERGASAEGQSLTDFVLASAQTRAEMVLADQNKFVLPPEKWKAFLSALDRPVKHHERLARLMSEPSILERD